MKIWVILFMVLPLIGIIYVGWHIWNIMPSTLGRVVAITLLVIWGLTIGAYALLDAMPMWLSTIVYRIGTSFFFVLLYLVIVFALLDLGRLFGFIPKSWLYSNAKSMALILFTLIILFSAARIKFDSKVRIPIDINTSKKLEKPLKIVLLSDLHLGYNIKQKEFEKWIEIINNESPDLVLIGGDIIDGNLRPLIETKMDETFHKIKAPIYACLGNHEYIAGVDGSIDFYKKAGINLLKDSATTINGINIIGRDDRTNNNRDPLPKFDDSLFTILLDHQPYNLEEAQNIGIDFQFSGHTHYGQVWPLSWAERFMYEQAYGPLKKGNTQYYVSSGMGIWGPRWRIGTKSEYCVLELH